MGLILIEKHKASNQERKQLPNSISVFTAEFMARLWALWWVEQTKPNSSVCTDPAAELMTLKDRRAEGRTD